jgi:hypothetical protein
MQEKLCDKLCKNVAMFWLQKEYDGAWNASLQATKSEEELQGTKGGVNELVAYHFHFKTISYHY